MTFSSHSKAVINFIAVTSEQYVYAYIFYHIIYKFINIIFTKLNFTLFTISLINTYSFVAIIANEMTLTFFGVET